MWPFNKRKQEDFIYTSSNKTQHTLTHAEFASILKLLKEFNESPDFLTQKRTFQDTQKEKDFYLFRDGMVAKGLREYALSYLGKYGTQNNKLQLDQVTYAVSVVLKAQTIYNFPFHWFLLASITEFYIDSLKKANAVKDLYKTFLDAVDTFKPNNVDEIFLKTIDLDGAIKQANERISDFKK